MHKVTYKEGELKPCPFCGDIPVLLLGTFGSEVTCYTCGDNAIEICVVGKTEQESKDKWNKRVS